MHDTHLHELLVVELHPSIAISISTLIIEYDKQVYQANRY